MARKSIRQFDIGIAPIRNSTLARQVTRHNLTLLNNAFWVTEHSQPVLMGSFHSISFPSGPTDHGCFGSEEQWKKGVEDQTRWVRQHVLVSAASLLETYLRTVIEAALWAHPEYVDRSATGVKEIEWIKFPERRPEIKSLIQQRVKVVLHGVWAQRFRQLEILFGIVPPALTDLSSNLQRVQDQRNDIAHYFGERAKSSRPTPWHPSSPVILSTAKVEEALTDIGRAVQVADQEMFKPLIGGYELLVEYHRWLIAQTDPFAQTSPDKRQRAFRKHVIGKLGSGPGKPYILSLIDYYDRCN
jgi:hypothetical protein